MLQGTAGPYLDILARVPRIQSAMAVMLQSGSIDRACDER